MRHEKAGSKERHNLFLERVTFAVAAGEAVAVLDANSAGKTTLLKILAR